MFVLIHTVGWGLYRWSAAFAGVIRAFALTYMTVKFEGFWVKGDLGSDAILVCEGASLRRYHYHGQAPNGGMRWCVFPEGAHPRPDPRKDQLGSAIGSPRGSLRSRS